jgi:hypothetical protein
VANKVEAAEGAASAVPDAALEALAPAEEAAARFNAAASLSAACGWAEAASVTGFTGCTRAAKVSSSEELSCASAAVAASAARLAGSEAPSAWAAVSDETPDEALHRAASCSESEPDRENRSGKTVGVVSEVGTATAISSRLPVWDGDLRVFGRRLLPVKFAPTAAIGFASRWLPESSRVALIRAVMNAEGWESVSSDEDEPEDCCTAGLDDAAVAEEFWVTAARLAETPFRAIWDANEIAAERIVTAEQKAAQAPLPVLRIFKRIGRSQRCWSFDSQPPSSEI